MLRSLVCSALVNGDTSSLCNFIGTHQLSLCPSRLFGRGCLCQAKRLFFHPILHQIYLLFLWLSTHTDLFSETNFCCTLEWLIWIFHKLIFYSNPELKEQ